MLLRRLQLGIGEIAEGRSVVVTGEPRQTDGSDA
jgi:hypothetical protein